MSMNSSCHVFRASSSFTATASPAVMLEDGPGVLGWRLGERKMGGVAKFLKFREWMGEI